MPVLIELQGTAHSFPLGVTAICSYNISQSLSLGVSLRSAFAFASEAFSASVFLPTTRYGRKDSWNMFHKLARGSGKTLIRLMMSDDRFLLIPLVAEAIRNFETTAPLLFRNKSKFGVYDKLYWSPTIREVERVGVSVPAKPYQYTLKLITDEELAKAKVFHPDEFNTIYSDPSKWSAFNQQFKVLLSFGTFKYDKSGSFLGSLLTINKSNATREYASPAVTYLNIERGQVETNDVSSLGANAFLINTWPDIPEKWREVRAISQLDQFIKDYAIDAISERDIQILPAPVLTVVDRPDLLSQIGLYTD